MDISNQPASSPNFIPGEVVLDPMGQVDDDITETLEEAPAQTIEVSDTGDVTTSEASDQDDSTTLDTEEVVDDTIDSEETIDTDGATGEAIEEANLDNYSQAALAVQLFAENGLEIYNELDKNLSFESLGKDIPQYIEQTAQTIADQKLKEYGDYADYLKLIVDKGIPRETLDPAIEVQKIASFDINNPNVTEDQLFGLVKEMHLRRDLNENEAEALANVSKNNKTLQADAQKSIEFHNNYITGIKQNALNAHNAELQATQDQQQSDYNGLITVVGSGKIGDINLSKQDQQNIVNTIHVKDQLVKWQDAEGTDQQSYVSKYDLGMYQVSQDPEKLALLAYLIHNDFSMKPIQQELKTNVSKQILARMAENGNTSKPARVSKRDAYNAEVKRNKKQTNSLFPSIEFDVI